MLGSLLAAPLAVAYHAVFDLAQFLAPLPGGLATATAIVAFTAGVRLLLSPLSFAALRGQARLGALQPRVADLQRRYARQPDRLQAELSALYRAEGGGMLAGCLPMIAQLPFFSVVYRLFLSATVAGGRNLLLAQRLATAQLGSHWLSGAGPASTQGLVFLGLFAVIGVTGFVSARASASSAGSTGSAGGAAGLLARLTPYASVVVAAFVPLAAGLYLATSGAWTAAERALWRHRGRGQGAEGSPEIPQGPPLKA